MITGEFTEDNQIIVSLKLFGDDGQEAEIEAILDTGFSNYLMVPDAAIGRLGMEQLDTVQAIMADGREAYLSVCEAVVEWDGEERNIPVFAV